MKKRVLALFLSLTFTAGLLTPANVYAEEVSEDVATSEEELANEEAEAVSSDEEDTRIIPDGV